MRRISIFAVLLALTCLASVHADTVVMRDGTTHEGRVLKGATQVAILTDAGKTLAFPLTDVAGIIKGNASHKQVYQTLKKDAGTDRTRLRNLHTWCKAKGLKTEAEEVQKLLASSGPATGPDTDDTGKTPVVKRRGNGATYMVIPIEGEIGKHVTAEIFDKCMDEVEKQQPDYVVLYVDSPGGSCDTAEKIVERIAKSRNVRTVAYIKSAISAAAIISMTCKQIVVENTATIGGATAYSMSPWGMPSDIGEKMQSIWRATCRSAAELGGHQRLIAEAMVDNGLELYLDKDEQGRPVVKEGTANGKRVLTRKGRLLTMTAKESVECGLAVGVVPALRDLHKPLKEGELSVLSDESETVGKAYAERIEKAAKELEEIVERYKDVMTRVETASSRRNKRRFILNAIRILEEAKRFATKNPMLQLDEKAIEREIQQLQALRRNIR